MGNARLAVIVALAMSGSTLVTLGRPPSARADGEQAMGPAQCQYAPSPPSPPPDPTGSLTYPCTISTDGSTAYATATSTTSGSLAAQTALAAAQSTAPTVVAAECIFPNTTTGLQVGFPCDLSPAGSQTWLVSDPTIDAASVVSQVESTANSVASLVTDSSPTDPTTYALPATPLDDSLGNLGVEDQPTGAGGEIFVYQLPKAQAAAVQAGQVSLGAILQYDASNDIYGVICGLSFRRRLDRKSNYDWVAYWGSRFSCNRKIDYANYRSRLVFYRADSQTIQYGGQINYGPYQNNISYGQTEFPFDPHLVVYVAGTLTFPTPPDPNNYVYGVADDPNSVDRTHSKCWRVGKTYQVECNARSISFQ